MQGLESHQDDAAKIKVARSLHSVIAERHKCTVSQQALGELYSVLVRAKRDREFAQKQLLNYLDEFETITPDSDTFIDAIELATEHKLQFWDALILATAASGGCPLLLSEDMQDGFAWRGVTVVNPFAAKMHKRLARVLEA
jgi:predicted nucleic acid-binding protein